MVARLLQACPVACIDVTAAACSPPPPSPPAPPYASPASTPAVCSATADAYGSTQGIQWRHVDGVARDSFPARECACTICSSASRVPTGGTSAARATPCFLEESSPSVRMFSDWSFGVFGSACWTLDGSIAARCLTPGDSLSHAPARGAYLGGGRGYAPQRVMFVVGDSHALHLVPGLAAAVAGRLSVAYTATLQGAGFNPVWPTLPSSHSCQVNPTWVCSYWKRRHDRYGGPAWVTAVRAALESQLQPGDVLTVVNSWLRMPTIEYVDAYAAFLGEMASTVAAKGATLLLLGDSPRLRAEGHDCLTPSTFGACATPRDRAWRLGWDALPPTDPSMIYAWSLKATMESRLAQLAASSSAVKYIPSDFLWDLVCDAGSGLCGPTIPGTSTVMYYGDHHFSTAGSMFLAPFINCEMAALGLL